MKNRIFVPVLFLFLGFCLALSAHAGDFKFSGYAQFLYHHYDLASQPDAFSLPRVRLTFDGIITSEVAYRVQYDAAAATNGLRDAYVQFKGSPIANLIIGQTFIPFSEAQLFPATDQELIDYSLVANTLTYDRDIGVQLRGELPNKKLSYGVGIFNGTGKNAAENNKTKDLVGRVVISPLSGLSFGLAYQGGDQSRSGTNEAYRTGFDALVKYEYAKLKIQWEYIYKEQQWTGGLSNKGSDGWYLLAAAYLSPKLQGAVRYDWLMTDRAVSSSKQTLLSTGVNYFFDPNIKFMANYLVRNEEPEIGNNEFELQLQIKY
jgi:phosphate-selective porin